MIGSNAPDAESNIDEAYKSLRRDKTISNFRHSQKIISRDYTNNGPDYINLVIAAETRKDIKYLTSLFKEIEASVARLRPSSPDTVAIDIDLVEYNDTVLKHAEHNSEAYHIGSLQITL